MSTLPILAMLNFWLKFFNSVGGATNARCVEKHGRPWKLLTIVYKNIVNELIFRPYGLKINLNLIYIYVTIYRSSVSLVPVVIVVVNDKDIFIYNRHRVHAILVARRVRHPPFAYGLNRTLFAG